MQNGNFDHSLVTVPVFHLTDPPLFFRVLYLVFEAIFSELYAELAGTAILEVQL